MLVAFIALNILAISYARPNNVGNPSNVITVPPNCPPGQQWINGACRDVWLKYARTSKPLEWNSLAFNQQLENSGRIRNIRQSESEMEEDVNTAEGQERRIINIPKQCPIGYRPDSLGRCRPIFNV